MIDFTEFKKDRQVATTVKMTIEDVGQDIEVGTIGTIFAEPSDDEELVGVIIDGSLNYLPQDVLDIDMFAHYAKLPQDVQDVLEKHMTDWEDSYDNCRALVEDLEKVGYTCEYYLDAMPFNLTKLNLEIKK